VRAFILVLDEISCGLAVFGDFLHGFSVSNMPPRPPPLIFNLAKIFVFRGDF